MKKIFLLFLFPLLLQAAPDMSVCKNEESWLAPKPLFKYDIACSSLLSRQIIPIDPTCGFEKIQDLYPNFTGEFTGNLQTVVPQEIVYEPFGVTARVDGQFIDGPGKAKTLRAIPEINLEKEALRLYCHKQEVKKVDDLFKPGYDVPASFISFWSKDYLKFKWEKELKGLLAKYPDTDLATFYNLNLQAADLWEKMSQCFFGDAEKAREAYGLSKFSCTNLQINGDELRKETIEYLESVRSYFMSSYFKKPKLLVNSEFELLSAMAENKPIVEISMGELPSLHPLFLQATMQILADIYDLGDDIDLQDLVKRLGKSELDARLLLGISQVFQFIPNMDANPMGLWPSVSRVVFRAIVLQVHRMLKNTFDGYDYKDYKVVGINANNARLPDFYGENTEEIATAFLEISARYKQSPEEIDHKKSSCFFCTTPNHDKSNRSKFLNPKENF